MNESPVDNTPESERDQLASLRYQFTSALMLLAGMSVIMTWYFVSEAWYRYDDSTRAVKAGTEMARQLNEFSQVNEPAFRDAIRKIQDYSRTHPDILPILNKYGVMQITNAPAVAPKK